MLTGWPDSTQPLASAIGSIASSITGGGTDGAGLEPSEEGSHGSRSYSGVVGGCASPACVERLRNGASSCRLGELQGSTRLRRTAGLLRNCSVTSYAGQSHRCRKRARRSRRNVRPLCGGKQSYGDDGSQRWRTIHVMRRGVNRHGKCLGRRRSCGQ